MVTTMRVEGAVAGHEAATVRAFAPSRTLKTYQLLANTITSFTYQVLAHPMSSSHLSYAARRVKCSGHDYSKADDDVLGVPYTYLRIIYSYTVQYSTVYGE